MVNMLVQQISCSSGISKKSFVCVLHVVMESNFVMVSYQWTIKVKLACRYAAYESETSPFLLQGIAVLHDC